MRRFPFPRTFFASGRSFSSRRRGRISNIVTTPGTLTLDVRFGSIVVFNGGAMPLNATAKTNVTWFLELLLTCRAIGTVTAANLIGTGEFCSESVSGAAAGIANTVMLPASAPAVGNGFDSTVANVVDLFGTWSLNNANSVQVHQYGIHAMN
jgi:hypothetical protein